jgi:mannitol/fructose-specific phosphotransferase system IIA component (Ntr-type)
MPIALADVLDERQIKLQMRSRRKPNALREIVKLLESTGTVREPSRFLAQVLEREEREATLAENGVAFPHARTDVVEDLLLAIGRSNGGISWNAAGERARLIFLVAVPQQLVNDYLVVVGALARAIKDDACRQALLRAQTPAEFIETLRDAPSL